MQKYVLTFCCLGKPFIKAVANFKAKKDFLTTFVSWMSKEKQTKNKNLSFTKN